MTESDRDMLRTRIREALDEVDIEIARLKESTRPVAPDNAIGRVSRMDAIGMENLSNKWDICRQRTCLPIG